MKIQYLGTAAAEAIPAIFCECEICRQAKRLMGRNVRGRSGCVINEQILIDFPPDIYFLSLQHQIDLVKVKEIFITHSHTDHFTPAELLMRMPGCYAILKDTTPVKLYGNKETKRIFDEAVDREFNVPSIDFIDYCPITYFTKIQAQNGITLTYLPANHKPDEEAGIFLVEDTSHNTAFLYAHDTGWFPEETFEYLKTLKLSGISLDCTNGKNYDGGTHMGLPNVLDVLEKLTKDEVLLPDAIRIVNHFSHNGKTNYDEMCELTKPYGIITSYDGMIVTV